LYAVYRYSYPDAFEAASRLEKWGVGPSTPRYSCAAA
jgi:hypothetical protein